MSNNENERRTLIGNIANELRSPMTMLKEKSKGYWTAILPAMTRT